MSNILFNKHSFIGTEQKTGKEISKGFITYMALENVHLSKENCFHWEPPVVPDLGLTHAVLTWLCYWTDQFRKALAGKSTEERSDTSQPPAPSVRTQCGYSHLLTEKCSEAAPGSLWQKCSKSHHAAWTSTKASSHSHSCSRSESKHCPTVQEQRGPGVNQEQEHREEHRKEQCPLLAQTNFWWEPQSVPTDMNQSFCWT